MPIVTILTWIKANWKPVLIALIFAATYLAGDHHGAGRIKVKWAEAVDRERAKAQAEHDRIQADADAKSAAYEADAAKQRAAMTTINRRLQDEISKNSVYRSCVVPDEFVRLYEATRQGNAAR